MEDAGTFSKSHDGTIYNRRMVREQARRDEISEARRVAGKKGGEANRKQRSSKEEAKHPSSEEKRREDEEKRRENEESSEKEGMQGENGDGGENGHDADPLRQACKDFIGNHRMMLWNQPDEDAMVRMATAYGIDAAKAAVQKAIDKPASVRGRMAYAETICANQAAEKDVAARKAKAAQAIPFRRIDQ